MKNLVVICLLLVFISGCKDDDSSDKQQPSVSPTEQSTSAQDKELRSDKFTPDFVQKNLKIGMTKDQVKVLFGDKFVEVTEAVSGEYKAWRYDSLIDPSYKAKPSCCDVVDIEGMEKQDIQDQLFVYWNENSTVKDYGLMNYESKNGKYSIHHLYPNGTVEIMKEGQTRSL